MTELQALSDADRESLNGVSPLVVSGVGETPGIQLPEVQQRASPELHRTGAPHILEGR